MSSDESFSWIDEEYVKTIITKFEGHDKIELSDFKVGSGAAQGENMAGVIKRVRANYLCDGSKKSTSFILKASPSAGAIADLLEDLGIFEREVFTYEKLHQEFEALLPGFKLAPRYYYKNIFIDLEITFI